MIYCINILPRFENHFFKAFPAGCNAEANSRVDEGFCDYIAKELTLPHVALFLLWTLSILVGKIADVASSRLWRWFVSSLGENKRLFHEDEALGDDSSGLSSVVKLATHVLSEVLEFDEGLIPPLPDTLDCDRVWTALINPPSVPLLFQLCRVSVRWSRFVIATIE